MSERLQFGPYEALYNIMDAAEHLARYQLLRDLCVGRRVLDIGCGEGFGAFLLSQWGAASVVAVDVSAENIEKARRQFPSDIVDYQVGDACKIADLMAGVEPFDLICCFEVVEHVNDAEELIAGIAQLRGPGCVVALSAPNDAILPKDAVNPFHLRRFDFASLSALTETRLGPATHWLHGAPIQGVALITMNPDGSDPDMRAAMPGQRYSGFSLIPPLANNRPSEDNVCFWVGLWGEANIHSAVAAPQSMTSWRETWVTLDYLKNSREHQSSELRRLGAVLAEERRGAEILRARLADLEPLLSGRLTITDAQLIERVAVEVWRERRRRRLLYKLRRSIKRLFGSKRLTG